MSKRVLDFDPLNRVTTFHHYDSLTDETTISTEQDVEPILDRNVEIQNWGGASSKGLNEWSRRGIGRSEWHVASIPVEIISKWRTEEGIDVFKRDHWPAVRRKLMDPEWRKLRTGTGRL